MATKDDYTRRTLITNVVDGDTFDSTVDLGFNVHLKVRFRLYGINCPELHGPSRMAGETAAEKTRSLILNKIVTVQCLKFDKYGRSVAKVTLDDGRDLTEVLIEGGFGVPYMDSLS